MLSKQIQNLITGEVDDAPETLERYSHDASIFEVRPQVVVHPKGAEDLTKLVRFVAEQKPHHPELSLTARSAGTCMSGGSINDSIILDFTTHFNRILEVGEGYAVTEPGVYYRDFEAATLARGYLLPCYTASKSLNTVGGMVGNNSAGEKTLTYGQTKDFVEGLSVVMADGEEHVVKPLSGDELDRKVKLATFEGKVYRELFQLIRDNRDIIERHRPQTSKNSSGYYLWDVWDGQRFDLTKLITGSQGTLGLVTKIRFRLVRPKPSSALLVVFLKDLGRLGDIVDYLKTFGPETLESFDDKTFAFAVRYLPEMLRQMKGNALRLFWQFIPELWLTVTGGVPRLILIAEFTGENQNQVRASAEAAQAHVEAKFDLKTHVASSPTEAQKYWTIRRESFNLLRHHVRGRHTAPFIDDVAVPPEYLPQFLPELSAILSRYPKLIYTVAGHAGDGNFHVIPLMDMRDQTQRDAIPELSERVYDLVVRYHGTITAEHNDGLVRTPYLGKMFGAEMVELFGRTKRIFDPLNIFNPRKKVGGSLGYLKEHVRVW